MTSTSTSTSPVSAAPLNSPLWAVSRTATYRGIPRIILERVWTTRGNISRLCLLMPEREHPRVWVRPEAVTALGR